MVSTNRMPSPKAGTDARCGTANLPGIYGEFGLAALRANKTDGAAVPQGVGTLPQVVRRKLGARGIANP